MTNPTSPAVLVLPTAGARSDRTIAILLVGLGGASGTGLRILVASFIPDQSGVPVGILTINLVGAFALGLVLSLLQQRCPGNSVVRQRLQLLIGTGLLGGFTTYSALATDTALLLADSALIAGIAYPIVTVLGGLLAAWAGIVAAQHLPAEDRRRRDA